MFAHTLIASALSLSLNQSAPNKAAPEETVRKAIDNICGDTWCEGDFRFQFTSVELDAKADLFTVNFVMTPYLDEETVLDEEGVTALVSPSASVKCVVKGYSDASVIVDKTGSLNWTVYEKLSKCVNSLESKLSK